MVLGFAYKTYKIIYNYLGYYFVAIQQHDNQTFTIA